MTKQEIRQECQKYNITRYEINADMSNNVIGNINLTKSKLSKIPLLFSHVRGNFDCNDKGKPHTRWPGLIKFRRIKTIDSIRNS